MINHIAIVEFVLIVIVGGGMGTYKFDKFFRSEDIEHENDLKVQEDLLKTVNNLIDEGILVMEDGKK